MTTFDITHTTRYRYTQAATLCHNQAHLTPRPTSCQRVEHHELVIEPPPQDRSERIDLYGNTTTFFSVQHPHESLVVRSTSRVDRGPARRSPSELLAWEVARDSVTSVDDRDLVLESPSAPLLAELARYASPVFWAGRPLLESVTHLSDLIHAEFRYEPGATTVSTPLRDVLAHRRGVCQDFAHLMIACLRSVGLAARYVSGYIETVPPPGGHRLVGNDASHAWCSVRLADGEWLDLDPTNAMVAPDGHITVAWGRDYGDVVPLQGVVLSPGGHTELAVEVDVARIGG